MVEQNKVGRIFTALLHHFYEIFFIFGSKLSANCVKLKESKIEIPQKWYEALLSHSYDADSVAWEMVLKTLLWVLRYSDNGEQVLTNEWIASELNTSVSTICSAKNVLEKDFEAIVRERVSIKLSEDHYMNIGQKITPCAWWDFQ